MFLPGMRAVSLKLFLSTVLTFAVADYNLTEKIRNCSLASRLNTDEVTPIKYDVKLTLMPDMEIIRGKTDITIDVKKQTTIIRLHARDLEVNSKCIRITNLSRSVTCDNSSISTLKELVFCPEYETLSIVFKEVIPRGKFILHIEHNSLFEKSLYKINYPYSSTGLEKRWLVTNLNTPNATRGLFPCWDDSTIKTSFRLSVLHTEMYTVFSNVDSWTSSYENEFQWTYFLDTQPIPVHSFAIAMVYSIAKDSQLNIHRLWDGPGVTEIYKYVETIADIVMSFLWKMSFNMTTLLDKIDHVILPDSPIRSAGKPGLIIYREKDVTYDFDADFPGRHIHVAKLVTYEIARQLFVGYMAPDSNNYLWINEIFASFYGYYALCQLWGKNIMELFVVQNLLAVLDYDLLIEQKPIMHKAKDDDGINGLLYPLLYHKKAFVLFRMLFHLLTPEYFDEAIKKYIHSRSADLWAVLQEEYRQRNNDSHTIREIMESWLMEKYHPEIKFVRNYNKRNVAYSGAPGSKNTRSKIPLIYATPDNINSYDTSNIIWYKGRQTKFISGLDSQKFFLVNMHLTGYYRVNYDNKNWQLLSAYLQSGNSTRIPALNRVQIISDAFFFASVGRIKITLFFDVIQFLKNETDYIVWYSMFNILSHMSTYLTFPGKDLVTTNFLNILDGLLRNVGYEECPEEGLMTRPLRLLAIKWACKLGHEGCRNATADKLTRMYHYDKHMIPWLSNWIYCAGMMTINMTVWEKILHVATEDRNMELLESLSCSENATIITHYLNLMLNTDSGQQKRLYTGKMYHSVVKKHVTKSDVLKFVLNNYNQTLTRFPADFANGTLMSNIIMNLRSEEQLEEVNKFIGEKFLHKHYKLWFMFLRWIEARRHQIRKELHKFRKF